MRVLIKPTNRAPTPSSSSTKTVSTSFKSTNPARLPIESPETKTVAQSKLTVAPLNKSSSGSTSFSNVSCSATTNQSLLGHINDSNSSKRTEELDYHTIHGPSLELETESVSPTNESSPTVASTSGKNTNKSKASSDRKRKVNENIDISEKRKSKPSPKANKSIVKIDQTITATPTIPSNINTSTNKNNSSPTKYQLEEKPATEKLRKRMGQYRGNDAQNNHSNDSSSSSRTYRQHRQLVFSRTTDEAHDKHCINNPVEEVEHEEEDPVYENIPEDDDNVLVRPSNQNINLLNRQQPCVASSSTSSERKEFPHGRWKGDEPEHGDGDTSSPSYCLSSKTPASKTVSTNRIKKNEENAVDENESFKVALKKKGLEMVEQDGDGNCLFRAVSLQVYGDPDVHMDVRKRCLDFMAKDEAHFSEFVVDEPFMQYILRKRQNGVHGNNPEIQAISELFNRPVEVFIPNNGATPINIFHADYKTCDVPIRLSYHDGNHYNAVIDPHCPTAGLGLGFPGLEPGLADRMQMQKAVNESEDLHVEKVAKESHEMEVHKAILESTRDSGSKGFDMYYEQKANAALMMSDLEATDYELEQQALVNSLESHYMKGEGQKLPWNHNRQQQQKQRQQKQHARDRRRHEQQNHRLSSSSSSSNRFLEASSSAINFQDTAHSSTSSTHVASLPPAASAVAASRQADADIPAYLLNSSYGVHDDEYPQTVQELVMNGFPLEKVLKAFDLIGDNFNDLITFLMSSSDAS